jgi:NAD(P)-dependent dehydrogenase (short-subunit alcohol dehydrogenase family)
MRIILIGASGTIGAPVADALSPVHDVVAVGRTSGDLRADISDPESLELLFEEASPFDAVVCAAGGAAFGALDELSDEDFDLGLSSKLMGQVNVVRRGLAEIADGGSFTLTSGVLAQEPMPGSSSISLVNAGVEAFVRAASLELPRDIRVNVVSPPWVSETLEEMGEDPSDGLPAAAVARSYVVSVEGQMSGRVLDPRDYV